MRSRRRSIAVWRRSGAMTAISRLRQPGWRASIIVGNVAVSRRCWRGGAWRSDSCSPRSYCGWRSPTLMSLATGGAIALAGEAVRVWAAGHVEKSREVTRSGPYRWTRHPLYLGSSIIGARDRGCGGELLIAVLVIGPISPAPFRQRYGSRKRTCARSSAAPTTPTPRACAPPMQRSFSARPRVARTASITRSRDSCSRLRFLRSRLGFRYDRRLPPRMPVRSAHR